MAMNFTQNSANHTQEPGWFTDPSGAALQRFWTGTRWTTVTRAPQDNYSLAVPGVRRSFFDHAVHTSSFGSRRLIVTDERIRWGQYTVAHSEVRKVSYWCEERVAKAHRQKFVFSVESRLGTMRIVLKGARSEEDRTRAFNGFQALVSSANMFVIPRLAVALVDRMSSGEVLTIAGYRLTSRGVSLHQKEGRRQELSGQWANLRISDGELHQGQVLLETHKGQYFPEVNPRDKGVAVLPLLLCLAQDKFGQEAAGDLRDQHLAHPMLSLRQYAGTAVNYAL
jgi:Protein of unknown function (DUF2510)